MPNQTNSSLESNSDSLHKLRHSTEHVLTQAMHNLYGKDKIIMAMGPATKDGFYFDFDTPDKFQISEKDFPKIEKEMQKIIKKNLPIKKEKLSVKQARKLFPNNSYKQEWLDKIKNNQEDVTVYWTGKDFVDLCRGPHINSTGEIKAFKLLSIAGAYWHGDENNKMLTRIYGTAFFSKKELKKHLELLEKAKNNDHRKIGQELNLFTFSKHVGGGLPLYTPKGTFIRNTLNQYIENVQKQYGYQQVWTPQISKAELFKKSGHYDKYKNDMFKVVSNYSDEEFFLKPMNCPQHTQIYASKLRSYKDLPIRMTDFAMLYRDEKPGELSGLSRVRSFSQDDCHIFCTENQVDQEIDQALKMTQEIMQTFDLKYEYRLSIRDPKTPEKYIGDPKLWDKLEQWAKEIMQRNKIDHYVGEGEAAFYAPKMDLMATDALGRKWQLSTIQIDMFMPERFELEYVSKKGERERPVMIHRAIIGSPERFIMILLEHFEGQLPLWLSPTSIDLLTISEKEKTYAKKIKTKFSQEGLRPKLDISDKTLGKKLALALQKHPPLIGIIGPKEQKNQTITLKNRQDQQITISVDKALNLLKQEIQKKSSTIEFQR